jgi:microsomal dipeptidase-like Zn-dependent dipeptidase
MMKISASIFLSLPLTISASGCAALVDHLFNATYLEPPYRASDEAIHLHKTLAVVDLHADQLLWNRELLKRAPYGHVDLPRLQEGNVALQVFDVVTGVPFPLPMENNRDRRDLISTLAYLQDWPEATHQSRLHRAHYQAEKLSKRALASKGSLMVIKSKEDLARLSQARGSGDGTIGGVPSLEGVHALEGEISNIDILYDAGFRTISLAHLTDNAMAGSAHGTKRHGLTEKGREQLKIIMEKI